MLMLARPMARWACDENDCFVFRCEQTARAQNQDGSSQYKEESLHSLEVFQANIFELHGERLADVQLKGEHP